MNHAAREAVVLPPNDGIHLVWDPASSIPTLIGSLLSLAATSAVILLWTFAGGKHRKDFRYALILNLTIAEFLNSLNNSVSGIAVNILKRPLFPSAACSFNGWAGQFSVQAIDFSILAISIITLLTIQLRSYIIYASTMTKVLVCISIWIIPLCTSLYALFKGYLGPVSGNWCWITSNHARQRYTLTHGWRFAILIITLCTYVFVFIYMSRRLKPQDLSRTTITTIDEDIDDPIEMRRAPRRRDVAVLSGCSTPPVSVHIPDHQARLSLHLNPSPRPATNGGLSTWDLEPSASPNTTPNTSPSLPRSSSFESANPIFSPTDYEKPFPWLPPPTTTTTKTPTITTTCPYPDSDPDPNPDPDPEKQQQRQQQLSTTSKAKAKIDREIWRMILLNMYPVTYFILWLPGIANRVAEAMDHPVKALVILQSSTQYIGLANACVYFYKEHARDLRRWGVDVGVGVGVWGRGREAGGGGNGGKGGHGRGRGCGTRDGSERGAERWGIGTI